MTVIVKELQQQLAQYKVRCAGVDTLAVVLKEAKQESVTLARQKKALETAIANLQNRLSTNNLSASVNIEETDLYVPGTSKQTLDNLARENARLRSLLKNTEHQPGKKSSEEMQELKTLVEDLESDKNQLQAQLQEVESIKLVMVKQYEETIASLKKDMAEEREKMMIEIDKYKFERNDMLKNLDKDSSKGYNYRDKKSVECQTSGMQLDSVDNIKTSLKLLAEQCKQLDEDLDNLDLSGGQQTAASSTEEAVKAKDEAYHLKAKLEEITLMNQRWQVHSDAKERQHIANVSELKNEIEVWKQEAEMNRAENMRYVQIVEELQRTLYQMRQKPQIDPSMVEILKQQIQVCTEDFNNERKDHEIVLRKKKELQAEVEDLKLQNEGLKQELETLKLRRTSSSSQPSESRHMMERRSWHPGQFPTQLQQQQQQQQLPQQQYSHIQARGEDTDDIPNLPPVPFLPKTGATLQTNPPLSYGRRAKSDSPFSFECEAGPFGLHLPGDTPQFMSHSQLDLVDGQSKNSQNVRPGALGSMPPLKRRSSDIDMLKNKGVMACPKCSKEFPEDQTDILLSHIDVCKD
ncbi:TNFAIP3-interacting protein 2 [Elysia marginata]|uniref:TNFAIP3-interacting protein 2 n=1 Tax=Elysia marginata TaxID=1093978 RepID=A0AAV4J4V3_9GAST|nr:TNFAIP3-interacting protein 2 [Elysia marginata]